MNALSDFIDRPAAESLRRALLALRDRAPMQPRAPLPGPPQRLNERGSPPGVCASCAGPLEEADAWETDGGQRVHRGGCPCDEAPRARRRT